MQNSIEELQLLQRAARKGRHDLVASLIMNGADINATDENGHTAAHQAARNGRVQVLEVLHALGADLNKCSKRGVSIAHQAAFGGHLAFLEKLVDFNVRMDVVDANNWTPLEIAMKEKRWQVVEYLEKLYSERYVVSYEKDIDTNQPQVEGDIFSILQGQTIPSPTIPTAIAFPHDEETTYEHLDVDAMNESGKNLVSLLPSPLATIHRSRKKRKIQHLLDAAFPTTPIHGTLLPQKLSPLHPPIASPSLQHKKIPGKGSWREKRNGKVDFMADDDPEELGTVHRLLYDM